MHGSDAIRDQRLKCIDRGHCTGLRLGHRKLALQNSTAKALKNELTSEPQPKEDGLELAAKLKILLCEAGKMKRQTTD